MSPSLDILDMVDEPVANGSISPRGTPVTICPHVRRLVMSQQVVLLACLHDNMLITFTQPTPHSGYSVNIWKTIEHHPLTIDTKCCSFSHNCCGSDKPTSTLDTPPFIILGGHDIPPTSPSASVVSDALFTYLFGSEATLSQSLVMVYGCCCGAVFCCPLKSPSSFDGGCHDDIAVPCGRQELLCTLIEPDGRGSTNEGFGDGRSHTSGQYVLCALGQPVLSIYVLYLPPSPRTEDNALPNCLLVIGCFGKIVVFSANDSSLDVQELFVEGPLLSSLLLPDYGLLISSTRSVQMICLRQSCLVLEQSVHQVTSLPPTLFEHPDTLAQSPLFLLTHRILKDSGDVVLLAMDLDGVVRDLRIGTSEESSVSFSHQMKEALRTIQASYEGRKRVEEEIAAIDRHLVCLNETINLFMDVSHHAPGSSKPFVVTLSIGSEQEGVRERSLYLKVSLHYARPRPVCAGVFLIVKLSQKEEGLVMLYACPTNCRTYQGTDCIRTVCLKDLTCDLHLKLPIPRNFNVYSSVDVACYLQYFPPTVNRWTNDVSQSTNDVVIPLHNETLSPLDMVEPLDTAPVLVTSEPVHSITLTITSSTIDRLHQELAVPWAESLSPRLLAGLVGSTPSYRTTCERHVRGGSVLEYRGLAADDSVMVYSLRRAGQSVVLTMSSSLLQCALVMADAVLQQIKVGYVCGGMLYTVTNMIGW